MSSLSVTISVFGSSQPKPNEPVYLEARWLGQAIGEAGWGVMTGGYMGLMEAVSWGAAEAGGHVIGVTCDEIESWRPIKPNRWIIEEQRYPSTRERLFALVKNCDAAVVLPGGIGTLAEVSFMWSQIQTQASPPKPLILVGPAWQSAIDKFISALGAYVAQPDTQIVTFAPDAKAAYGLLRNRINRSQ